LAKVAGAAGPRAGAALHGNRPLNPSSKRDPKTSTKTGAAVAIYNDEKKKEEEEERRAVEEGRVSPPLSSLPLSSNLPLTHHAFKGYLYSLCALPVPVFRR